MQRTTAHKGSTVMRHSLLAGGRGANPVLRLRTTRHPDGARQENKIIFRLSLPRSLEERTFPSLLLALLRAMFPIICKLRGRTHTSPTCYLVVVRSDSTTQRNWSRPPWEVPAALGLSRRWNSCRWSCGRCLRLHGNPTDSNLQTR